MGGGSFSADVYSSRSRARTASGTPAFAYSKSMHSASAADRKVHERLEPKLIKRVREARDSADHPESLPIAVLFDVTGSMSTTPEIMQAKLPQFMGALLRNSSIKDPAILVGAIGDATCDTAGFQVGQFESDNRIEDDLTALFLEKGGGGQDTESYELGLFFLARLTATDAWEKRGKKGYAILMGDERAYPAVKKEEVQKVFGITLQEDIPFEVILAEAKTKWEIFFITPGGTSNYGRPSLVEFWKKAFGQRYIQVEDMDSICETMSLLIGFEEGGDEDIDLTASHLIAAGADTASVKVASKALATYKPSTTKVSKNVNTVNHISLGGDAATRV